jgi:hypothetical protein
VRLFVDFRLLVIRTMHDELVPSIQPGGLLRGRLGDVWGNPMRQLPPARIRDMV